MQTRVLSAKSARLQRQATAALLGAVLAAAAAQAQTPPVTDGQRTTAERVAQAGVPLSELAPNAPDQYTVKAGDTLWAISGLFLNSPWRWPELWGMNLNDIRNPHRIYPGQQLFLDRSNGRAVLRMGAGGTAGSPDGRDIATVRVSPRTRYESLVDATIPTLQPHLIEPFLAEAQVVEADTLSRAPRLVATQEGRVLLSRGDRAYAASTSRRDLLVAADRPREFRVYRDATPLKDPGTGEILAYEAQFIGRVRLARGESVNETRAADGKVTTELVPATVDVLLSKEEIRIGDRLLPEPPRELTSYSPRAPERPVAGQIMSVYGSAVTMAAQNQVVVINRGTRDGLERGHVLALLKDGTTQVDRTDPTKPTMKLPDERNGLLMVFRPFERVSYALVLQITDGVRIGDRVVNPR